jgi:hypothetical protein
VYSTFTERVLRLRSIMSFLLRDEYSGKRCVIPENIHEVVYRCFLVIKNHVRFFVIFLKNWLWNWVYQ